MRQERASENYGPLGALEDDSIGIAAANAVLDKESRYYHQFRTTLAKAGVAPPDNLKRKSAKRAAADDEELQVEQNELSVICPLSQAVMTDPVQK